MYQGSSLKGDVATIASVGDLRHSPSVRVTERVKHVDFADSDTFQVNTTSARDTTGSTLEADRNLSARDQNSTTSLSGLGE